MDENKTAGWQPAAGGGRNDGEVVASGYQYSTTAHKTQAIEVDGRGVGAVVGRVFVKRLRGSRHMLRKPAAWAFTMSTLLEAQRRGARTIDILDTETGRRYSADIADVLARGFRFDRGHGRQVGFPLEDWHTGGGLSETPDPETPEPEPTPDVQPKLFELEPKTGHTQHYRQVIKPLPTIRWWES